MPLYAPPTASGGDVVKIAEVVLAATAATIDFSNIPQTYKHLQIVGTFRETGGISGDNILVRLNNLSTALYDYHMLRAADTTASGFSAAAQTSWIAGYCTGSLAAAGEAGPWVLDIPAYSATTLQKNAIGRSSRMVGGNPALFTTALFGLAWHSTSAITQVTVIPGNGSWDIGTRASLYGIS